MGKKEVNLFEKMIAEIESFKENAEKLLKNGNKSAGRRSRVATLNFEKLAKQWRKDTVKMESEM